MITVLRIGRRWLSGSARTLWHKLAATVPAGPGPRPLGYFIQLFVPIAGGGGEFHYRDTGRGRDFALGITIAIVSRATRNARDTCDQKAIDTRLVRPATSPSHNAGEGCSAQQVRPSPPAKLASDSDASDSSPQRTWPVIHYASTCSAGGTRCWHAVLVRVPTICWRNTCSVSWTVS